MAKRAANSLSKMSLIETNKQVRQRPNKRRRVGGRITANVQRSLPFGKTDFVRNINGTTGFSVQMSEPISMLNPILFPYGSQILPNYEMYRVRKMRFHFKSFSGNVTTTGALGSVIMGVVYDPNDNKLSDRPTMLNYQGFREAKIDTDLYVDLVTKNNPLPVRYVTHNTNANEFNDYGVFYLATDTNPSTTVIGELKIEYEIELYIPRPNTIFQTQVLSGSIQVGAGVSYALNSNGYSTNIGPKFLTALSGGLSTPSNYGFNMPGFYNISVYIFSVSAATNVTGGNTYTNGALSINPGWVDGTDNITADAFGGTNTVAFSNSYIDASNITSVVPPQIHWASTLALTFSGTSVFQYTVTVTKIPNVSSTVPPTLPELMVKVKELEGRLQGGDRSTCCVSKNEIDEVEVIQRHPFIKLDIESPKHIVTIDDSVSSKRSRSLK